MSWYKIFYWISVADGVKSFFDTFSNIFTWMFGFFFLVWVVLMFLGIDPETNERWSESELKSLYHWRKMIRGSWIVCSIFMIVLWAGYVFTPTKRDAMVIVAGGAVANFVTSDSSAKQIPAELTLLIREQLKSEIEKVKNPLPEIKDTLQSMTKDELIDLIKAKK